MLRSGAEVLKREVPVVALAALAAAIVFTWPQALDPGGSVASYSDIPYNAWVLGWVASRVPHALDGVWSAPVFFPYRDTLRYVEPLFGIAVPLAPIYWVTGNAILLHNVAVWLSFGIAGTGGYLLGRDVSGSRPGGVIAAAFTAFVPYRFAHLVHVQILMAGWLWWTAWSVHRYFARPSWIAAVRCAAFYSLLGLSSLYWAYIGLVPIGLLVAVECWRSRPRLMPLRAHATGAGLILAAVFLPVALELGHITAADSPLISSAESRAAGADLSAYVRGRPSLRLWGGVLGAERSGEADLFPGVTVFACALLSMLQLRAKRPENSYIPLYASLVAIGVALSLGPTPSLNGHVLLRNPVFDWLAPLPGFAQLRAIARFVVIAQLGLSVLAAYGIGAWLERRRASRREVALTTTALAALVFIEGFGAPVDLRPFSPYVLDGDRSTYHWLARHPGGAAIELPLEGWSDTAYGIYYQYRTLLHEHPTVNGVGRFRPPLLAMLSDPDSPVGDPSRVAETTALLRGLGVRYVVLHRNWFSDGARGEGLRSAFVGALGSPAAEFGASTIVDLGESTPIAEPPAREVPRELLNVSVVRGNAAPLVDGNVATRWLSGRPQDGTEWIEVGLASLQLVTGVRLHLTGRSLNDYPRGLEVDVAGANGEVETVWSSSVLAQLGAGLRAEPANPAIELRWHARPSRMVRLRQIGRSARWYWSVHEIDVLSAPFNGAGGR